MKYRYIMRMPCRDHHGGITALRRIVLEVEADSPEHAQVHMREILEFAWEPHLEGIKPVGKKKPRREST